MQLAEIGIKVAQRRKILGLSVARLARLSKISPKTIGQLETGSLKEMGFHKLQNLLWVLALSFGPLSTESRQRKKGMEMAANTSNVSYKSVDLHRKLTHFAGNFASKIDPRLIHNPT